MIQNYNPGNKDDWSGRTDSETNYNAFRWHQWVQTIDLNDKNLSIDIPEAGLGFAILGFESDLGIDINKGRTGAAKAPKSIRSTISSFPCSFEQSVKIFDAGNISADGISLAEAQASLADAVDKVLSLNLFPIVLGGGHDTALGHYQGIFKNLNAAKEKPNIGVINFDAHFDFRPYEDIGSSGTMFRQIRDLNKANEMDYSYMVLGIQKHGNTIDLFNFAKESGTEYLLARDINKRDLAYSYEHLDNFMRDLDHIHLTICTDVFPAAYAPGVSAPQPIGLDPEKAIDLIRYILASNKTVGFDIAEVSPDFDQDNITSRLASVLIFESVSKICEMHNLNIEL